MTDAAYTLFETALGRCVIAWREHRVVAFHLPGGGDQQAVAALRRRWPELAAGEPPEPVGAAMDAVRGLLEGAPLDLSFVEIALEGVSDFDRNVYRITRTIPPGATLTYGEIARQIGDAGAARAIGRALGDNPISVIVPCHRVLAASGKIGGFSAPGGIATKRRLLAIESAHAPLPLFAASGGGNG